MFIKNEALRTDLPVSEKSLNLSRATQSLLWDYSWRES